MLETTVIYQVYEFQLCTVIYHSHHCWPPKLRAKVLQHL